MIESLTGTHGDWAAVIARIVLGIVFFAHGAQKMLGWYGGPGLASSMRTFTEHLHLPSTLAFSVNRGGIAEWNRTDRRAFQQNCRPGHRAYDGGRYCNGSFPIRPLFELVWKPRRTRDRIHLLTIALALIVGVQGAGAFSLDRIVYEHASGLEQSIAGGRQ
jgi:uncharacterized membrane protein YphA (DoxX/SURF4 family)